jgi:GNAT superfamily N-acetyltransferase
MNLTEHTIKIATLDSTNIHDKIIKLLNTSYYNPKSWTNMNKQVVSEKCDRCSKEELINVLNNPNCILFYVEDPNKQEIITCASLEYEESFFYSKELQSKPHFTWGYFAVNTDYQSKGIGKQVMLFIERLIKLIYNYYTVDNISEQQSIIKYFNSNYQLDFDITENVIKTFNGNNIKQIEDIYIACIYEKKELMGFYIKYGYKDIGYEYKLANYYGKEYILENSSFHYLIKSINSI